MRCARNKNWQAGINGRAELARRETGALEQARKELAEDLKIRSALQFAFYEQWQRLAALLFGARDSHRGRRCDIRELR